MLLRSCCLPKVSCAAREIPRQVREPIDPQAQVDALRADVDAFDQQLDDARLLGREQLVPEWVEVSQGLPH